MAGVQPIQIITRLNEPQEFRSPVISTRRPIVGKLVPAITKSDEAVNETISFTLYVNHGRSTR